MTKSDLHKLQKEFLSFGGSERMLKKIGNSLTLRNEARLKYEIKKLKPKKTSTPTLPKPKPKEESYTPKVDFKDFISEYPPELHSVYIQRGQLFLKACSLKVLLNDLKDDEELQAGKLQWKIWDAFQQMDKCIEVLEHWTENKRILPTQTPADFTEIPAKKLNRTLLNLRSNLSKRKKTVRNLQANMPDIEHSDFKTKHNLLNRKLEELKELELQIEKLNSIINE